MKDIYILEDDLVVVELIKFYTRNEKYNAIHVKENRLNTIDSPKIIIVDINLSLYNGFNLAHYLREIHGYDFSIIFVSADEELQGKLSKENFSNSSFCQKPLIKKDFMKILNRMNTKQ